MAGVNGTGGVQQRALTHGAQAADKPFAMLHVEGGLALAEPGSVAGGTPPDAAVEGTRALATSEAPHASTAIEKEPTLVLQPNVMGRLLSRPCVSVHSRCGKAADAQMNERLQ
jgi:hypothetical protein